MGRALDEYAVEGIRTSISFHKAVLVDKHFRDGDFDTSFIDKHFTPGEARFSDLDAAIAAAALKAYEQGNRLSLGTQDGKRRDSPWKTIGRLRGLR